MVHTIFIATRNPQQQHEAPESFAIQYRYSCCEALLQRPIILPTHIQGRKLNVLKLDSLPGLDININMHCMLYEPNQQHLRMSIYLLCCICVEFFWLHTKRNSMQSICESLLFLFILSSISIYHFSCWSTLFGCAFTSDGHENMLVL